MISRNNMVLVLIFIAVFVSLCLPIEEYDFFWNLGAGQWILSNGYLPSSDPFSYPGSLPDTRDLFVLKAYWLMQVVTAAIWSFAGPIGIVLFRALLLTCMVAVIFLAMRRAGFSPWLALFFVLPVYFDFRLLFFNAVRPQLFSFLFTALLFFIIESRSFKNEHRKFFLLFSLTLIWGNLHPAVLFGFLVLNIYSFVSFVESWRSKRGYSTALGYMLASTGAFCNPNSWQVLKPLLLPFDSTKNTILYYSNHPDGMTILQLWDLGVFVFWGGVFAFLFGLFVLIADRKTIRKEHILVFALVVSLAIFKGRFLIFLTISTMLLFPPYIKDRLDSVLQFNLASRKVLSITSFFLVVCCGSYILFLQGSGFAKTINLEKYPVNAVSFLKTFAPSGNLLNPYEWGGFLIVNYPEKKVFVDGRGMQVNKGKMMDFEILRTGFALNTNDIPVWKKRMQEYGVGIVLSHRDNQRFPLNTKLMKDPGWVLAFQDDISNVFIKKKAKH